MLRWAGLKPEMFASGETFVASASKPDCVVLDLHMPGMNGFDVLAQLATATVPVPVVVITGHDSPENRQRTAEAGASAYLLKPVDGPALLAAINAAVGHDQSIAEA
jgi:FixJ family two-component response regulator